MREEGCLIRQMSGKFVRAAFLVRLSIEGPFQAPIIIGAMQLAGYILTSTAVRLLKPFRPLASFVAALRPLDGISTSDDYRQAQKNYPSGWKNTPAERLRIKGLHQAPTMMEQYP